MKTAEQRRANVLAVQAWRKNPAGKRCVCGNQAVTAAAGEFVCERCRRLETHSAQRQLRRVSAGVVGATGQMHALKEWQFGVRVWEQAQELVVRAHGEYHLALRK